MQTHLEPLGETAAGEEIDIDTAAIEAGGTRGDRSRAARAALRPHGRRHRRLPDARASAARARSPTRTARERDRGARAQCRPGDRRRRGTHRALMRLCMFHPVGHPLERGWVGRVDGDRVLQLAAQTLQSFFTGGGTAREHAEYPLEGGRAPRAGAPPAVRAPLRRPDDVRVREPGSCRRARCARRSVRPRA